MQSDSALLRELLALPQKQTGNTVHLDVSAVTFADSLLLAVLLELQRQLQGQQKCLLVSGVEEGMLSLARVYGIDILLKNMMEVT